MNDSLSSKQYSPKIVEIFVYFILFLFFVRLIAVQIILGPDYAIHIKIIDQFVNGNFDIPHPGFHLTVYWLSKITTIPYAYIIPFFISTLIILTIFITKRILVYLSPGITNPFYYLLFSVAINMVIAVYVPIFNPFMYIGQWSPNIWHSPTMTYLKPFALIGFFGIIILLKENGNLKFSLLFLIALSLLIGTFIKPSFIICLLPAVCLFLIIFRFKHFDLYLKMFWIFLPSILLLIYQFIETYFTSISDSQYQDKIILTWFGVAKLYTSSVIISTVLVIAFPLSVLSFSYKHIRQNTPLLLSWMLVVISFFVSGIFAEQNNFAYGNFIFSYVICLFVVYVFSLCEYLNWFNAFDKNKIRILIVGFVFTLHVLSGASYLYKLLNQGGL